jgi:hypothetical protein
MKDGPARILSIIHCEYCPVLGKPKGILTNSHKPKDLMMAVVVYSVLKVCQQHYLLLESNIKYLTHAASTTT